ncbi:hypothetical protein Q0590_21280 [Rhodocytophaga aerolata]|uniref:Uncharacterized protein n=1 Tax=Rhodocytophaga aerolata TaxID=455078 RepID=A0ABT8RBX1_9BACT|nr:hypothetical protein [Rhodocytophaga aerolata]MDO1448824.1 hypothetical protein [Rhodocytophaga aerolata]
MPSLNQLIENILFTKKIHTRVPTEMVDLDSKVQELFAAYRIKQSTKRELFSWLHKPVIDLPKFTFPIEVNSVVYSISGRIDKGRNFDKIAIKLKANRLLMGFYWFAFLFTLVCTFLLIQKSGDAFIIGLNVILLLRIVLFFISCNQELTKIQNRMTGFLMKSNVQQPAVLLKKRA